ncbi:MAG TPA: hypothetical protein DCQ28_04415 [Bacteroidetes bacterium]|nr:hypothetical protein [Bacteroidota bacterium]
MSAQFYKQSRTEATNETATNHNISTLIEVTQTSMNRYLQTQYNAVGFPREIIVSGTSYKIYLALPEVNLAAGSAKLQMEFDVKDGSNLLYHFVIQPSLNIDTGQIRLTQIQAFLTNLQATLDAVTPILPSWVETNIISNFNTRGWIAYPSKLINQINTTLFAQQSIRFIDATLQTQIIPNTLQFVITVSLSSSKPVFWVSMDGDGGNLDDFIYFKTNLDVKVKEVIIVPLGGSNVIYHGYPDVTSPKSLSSQQYLTINMGNIGVGTGSNCIVKARFQHDNTWYVREYPLVPVNSTSWYGATKLINN